MRRMQRVTFSPLHFFNLSSYSLLSTFSLSLIMLTLFSLSLSYLFHRCVISSESPAQSKKRIVNTQVCTGMTVTPNVLIPPPRFTLRKVIKERRRRRRRRSRREVERDIHTVLCVCCVLLLTSSFLLHTPLLSMHQGGAVLIPFTKSSGCSSMRVRAKYLLYIIFRFSLFSYVKYSYLFHSLNLVIMYFIFAYNILKVSTYFIVK